MATHAVFGELVKHSKRIVLVNFAVGVLLNISQHAGLLRDVETERLRDVEKGRRGDRAIVIDMPRDAATTTRRIAHASARDNSPRLPVSQSPRHVLPRLG